MHGALPLLPLRGRSFAPFALLLLALGAGCDDARSRELPEWTPADHDNQGAPSTGQVDTKAPRPGMPELEQHGVDDVVLATWKQNCVRCHGVIGRGDGPEGLAQRPTDLTDPAWHRRVTDLDIAATIKGGRGKMPAFGTLPDRTLQGLVRLVRLLNPERGQSAGAAPAGESPATEEPAAKGPSGNSPAAKSPAPTSPSTSQGPER